MTEDRKVGVPLGMGIFLAPHIFAWFTLRAGYSQAVRVRSFAWLAVVSIAVASQPSPSKLQPSFDSEHNSKQAAAPSGAALGETNGSGISIVVQPTKENGKPWDSDGEAPDIAICLHDPDKDRSCVPPDLRRSKCPNSYDCFFVNEQLTPDTRITIWDLDLMSHDVVGAGKCAVPEKCVLGQATITLYGTAYKSFVSAPKQSASSAPLSHDASCTWKESANDLFELLGTLESHIMMDRRSQALALLRVLEDARDLHGRCALGKESFHAFSGELRALRKIARKKGWL